ncbi:MAG: sugar transferase [Proteobacteria bacterium]|nr:sugar transferase [Pseudomonadota bacterium]
MADSPLADDVTHAVNGKSGFGFEIAGREPLAGRAAKELHAAIVERVKADGFATLVVPAHALDDKCATAECDALHGMRRIELESLYEDLFGRVALPLIDDSWFAEVRASKPNWLYEPLKRTIDIVLSGLALVLLSPVWLVIALALTVQGGPPLIFQERVGRDGKTFALLKFRTMLFDDGEDPEKKKHNRITKIGAFLRRTQLDEAPQFWNVLRGDLSLIGPRPEIPHLVATYAAEIPYYLERHSIRPGISGWAQIKHASPPKFGLDVEATREKLSYDLYYLRHRSIAMEIAVILGTLKQLLGGSSR